MDHHKNASRNFLACWFRAHSCMRNCFMHFARLNIINCTIKGQHQLRHQMNSKRITRVCLCLCNLAGEKNCGRSGWNVTTSTQLTSGKLMNERAIPSKEFSESPTPLAGCACAGPSKENSSGKRECAQLSRPGYKSIQTGTFQHTRKSAEPS